MLQVLNLLGAHLCRFADQGLVDMRQDTTTRNGCLDKRIQFLVTTDSQLKMSWRDTLHLQVFRRVACQLEHFGRQVFENSRGIHCCFRAHTDVGSAFLFQIAVDTTDWKLSNTHADTHRHTHISFLLLLLFFFPFFFPRFT